MLGFQKSITLAEKRLFPLNNTPKRPQSLKKMISCPWRDFTTSQVTDLSVQPRILPPGHLCACMRHPDFMRVTEHGLLPYGLCCERSKMGLPHSVAHRASFLKRERRPVRRLRQ